MSTTFSVRTSRDLPPVSLTLSTVAFWSQKYAPWAAAEVGQVGGGLSGMAGGWHAY
jgi:hypothetical protein